jgi:glutathione S-transferase
VFRSDCRTGRRSRLCSGGPHRHDRDPAQGLGRVPYDMLIAEFGERLDDLAMLLGEQAFFYADRPSVADFAIYGVFSIGCAEGGNA